MLNFIYFVSFHVGDLVWKTSLCLMDGLIVQLLVFYACQSSELRNGFFFINGNLWSLASLTYLINKFLLFSCSCTRCCSLHQCDTNEVSFTYSRSAWLTPWHLLFPFIVCSLAVSVAFVVCDVRHRLKRVSFMVSHIEMEKRRKKMIKHLRSRWPALFMFCALGCKDVVCHCVCTESSIFSKTE